MHPEIDRADVELLRSQGMNEADVAHSIAVAEKALDISGRMTTTVDRKFLVRGALLHDLGKARCRDLQHGRVGAEMGAGLGIDPALCDLMEKHIRGGLTEAEARELGLPVKDYRLQKLEERIIIYADRLVDIITDGEVPLASPRDAEDRFEDILRANPKYGKNEATMYRYFNYHQEIQGLIAAAENESFPA